MTTTTARPVTSQSERVLFGKLWWVGPLAIVGAIVANLAATALFQAVLRPDPAFLPLSYGAVGFFTAIGTIGAVIVYAIVGRFSRRPITLYSRIALGVLLVSLIPDLMLPFQAPAIPGVNWPNVIALMLLHVIAWAVVVPLLTRMAGEE